MVWKTKKVRYGASEKYRLEYTKKISSSFYFMTFKAFCKYWAWFCCLWIQNYTLNIFWFNFPNCSFLHGLNFLSRARDFAGGRISLRDRLISALQSSFCNPQFAWHAITFVSCNITCFVNIFLQRIAVYLECIKKTFGCHISQSNDAQMQHLYKITCQRIVWNDFTLISFYHSINISFLIAINSEN